MERFGRREPGAARARVLKEKITARMGRENSYQLC